MTPSTVEIREERLVELMFASQRSADGRLVVPLDLIDALNQEIERSLRAQADGLPRLIIHDDGDISIAGEPVDVSGRPASIIEYLDTHGSASEHDLAELWRNTKSKGTSATIRKNVSEASTALKRHGMKIKKRDGLYRFELHTEDLEKI